MTETPHDKVLLYLLQECGGGGDHLALGQTTVYIFPNATRLQQCSDRVRRSEPDDLSGIVMTCVTSGDENGVCSCGHAYDKCALVAVAIARSNDPHLLDIKAHRALLWARDNDVTNLH